MSWGSTLYRKSNLTHAHFYPRRRQRSRVGKSHAVLVENSPLVENFPDNSIQSIHHKTIFFLKKINETINPPK